MRIDVHHHAPEISQQILDTLRQISTRLGVLEEKLIMALKTLEDLRIAVAKNSEVDASAIILLNGLTERLKNLAPTQAAIDAFVAELEAKNQELADAVVANTPAE